MTIISADFTLICDDNFTILQNVAICFNEKIKQIAPLDELKSKYPNAKVISLGKNSIILPGLINPHTHLEFSANRSILRYGSFVPWLNSVIENRDEIMELSTNDVMQSAMDEMKKSGVTTIGAISSQGLDLEVCETSSLKVVYFNEILGSNPSSVDILYEDFKQRLNLSLRRANSRFFPAISVHSPYSTHPVLAKKVLQIAKSENLLVSTHFMESFAERQWIDEGKGEFKEFFAPFNPNAKPFLKADKYLKLFKDCKTLFTHCVYASEDEFEIIKDLGATITHCPTSNRLLGSGAMNILHVKNKNINLTVGTDGYSSNKSLNIWDELRATLFLHVNENLENFARDIIKSVTLNAQKALGLNIGSLEVGKCADISVFKLEQIPKDLKQLPLQMILHVKKAEKIFIQGEEIGK